MRTILKVTGLAVALISASCSPVRADAFWGGVVGASLGGFLGSTIGRGDGRVAAAGLGIATGAVIGSSVGASLDRPSYPAGGAAYYQAPTYVYPAYRPTYVAPPDPPVRVVYVTQPVVVTGSYVGASAAQECRPFVQTTEIGGEVRKTQGLACLQPDGTWRVQ